MRKVLVVVSGLLTAALIVVAVMSGIVLYGMGVGKARYEAGSYAASAQAYDVARRTIPDQFGRWEAYLGSGTAEARAGALESATRKLSIALTLVPKDADSAHPAPTGVVKDEDYTDECTVRINLSIVYTARGDRFSEAGYAQDAADQYKAATRAIGTCAEQGQKAKDQQEEAEGKEGQARTQAKSQEGKSKQLGKDNEAQDNPGRPDEELKDIELQKRAQDAERQRRNLQEYDKNFGSRNGENW